MAELGPLQCGAHPGQALGYWCRQDAAAVCAHCCIFGPHRGHDAAPVEEELRALLARLVAARAAVAGVAREQGTEQEAALVSELERRARVEEEGVMARLVEEADLARNAHDELQMTTLSAQIEFKMPDFKTTIKCKEGKVRRRGDTILVTAPTLALVNHKVAGIEEDFEVGEDSYGSEGELEGMAEVMGRLKLKNYEEMAKPTKLEDQKKSEVKKGVNGFEQRLDGGLTSKPGDVVEVEVLRVASPGEVWVRQVSDTWRAFHLALQRRRRALGQVEQVEVGCLLLASCGGMVARGEVRAVTGDTGEVRVRLVDFGTDIVVIKEQLGILEDRELRAAAAFSFPVAVRGLEAAGRVGWSVEAATCLASILRGEAVWLGRVEAGVADVWVRRRTNQALEMEVFTWTSVAALLVGRGVALRRGTRGRLATLFPGLAGTFQTGEEVLEEPCLPASKEVSPTLPSGAPAAMAPPLVGGTCFPGTLERVDREGVVRVRRQGGLVAVELTGVTRVGAGDMEELGRRVGNPRYLEALVSMTRSQS